MTHPIKHHVPDLAETARVATDLAKQLSPGCCIALHGELGAGKTTFTRFIVTALGGQPRDVSSPTFALLNIYQTPLGPVFHIDTYRTSGPDDLESMGFEELLTRQGFVIVEWPDRAQHLLPADRFDITITPDGTGESRVISVTLPARLTNSV
jgi:tRNA threonylcarbamoyladenosine biosynthesis protein TsaE